MAWGTTEQKQETPAPTLSPVDRARAAFEGGDGFFQVQLVVNEVKAAGGVDSCDNTVYETEDVGNILGDIEFVGWHLEHVGYTFVEKASRSWGGPTLSQKWSAGQTIGIYLFRRSQG